MREARRAKAAEYRAAMNSGDIKKLPARERVAGAGAWLATSSTSVAISARCSCWSSSSRTSSGSHPSTGLKAVAFYLLPLCLIGIVADSIFIGRKVTQRGARALPQLHGEAQGLRRAARPHAGSLAPAPAPSRGHRRPLDPAPLVTASCAAMSAARSGIGPYDLAITVAQHHLLHPGVEQLLPDLAEP